MRRGRIPELGLFLLGYQLLKNIGLTNIPPVTLVSIIVQVSIYLNVVNVPRLCISGASVARDQDWLRLVVPSLRHTHDIHLYYNMVSLAWKGLEMERRLGSVKYFITLILLTFLSSIFYVILAMVGAEVLEDPTLMTECAIGFSGVLFAMKVVNIHHSNQEQERTSFFGFLVPMRYAVWLELLIIQIMVPKSSFLGHLAGILAGLVFVKGPIASILSLNPPAAYHVYNRRGRQSSSNNLISSILPTNPITIILCLLQSCLFFGLIPNLRPLTGCFYQSRLEVRNIKIDTIKTILTSPLYHLSVIHLGINLVSLYMKGKTLEPKLGCFKFIKTVVTAVIATCLTHVLLTEVVSHVYPDLFPANTCISGLSATLFCLKVITLRHSNSLDTCLMFELAELIMLMEQNTRVYHVSGLVTGVIMLCWCADMCGDQSWSRPGHVLGHGNHGGQPEWTRSWGYAGYQDDEEDDYHEAVRRSQQTYYQEQWSDRNYTPSAPPAENGDGGVVPDMVGVRPPLYAQEPAPPPPGQAYRVNSGSRSVTDDEDLRRRRLQRFS